MTLLAKRVGDDKNCKWICRFWANRGMPRGGVLPPTPVLALLKLRFFATCVGGGFPPFRGFGQNGGDGGGLLVSEGYWCQFFFRRKKN